MKEMKEECFEMFLVMDLEIGYFISLNGRHRPHLKFIWPQEEEIVRKADHCLKVPGRHLRASDHNKYYSVQKVEDPATLRENLFTE